MKRSFFFNAIYVIQCLEYTGEEKDRTGKTLFESVVQPKAKEAGVHARFIDALPTRAGLVDALESMREECKTAGFGPLLHLETHGTEANGIGAHERELLSWAALKPILVDLNTISGVNLLVTMAACRGLNLVRTLLPTDRVPVWGLVGPKYITIPTDIRAGFRAFYGTMLETFDFMAAFRALRAADTSYAENWRLQTAELFFAYAFGAYMDGRVAAGWKSNAEDEIVKDLAKKKGLRGLDLDAARAWARAKIKNVEPDFEKMKRQYFMSDLFPENIERFPISLPEAENIYKKYQALFRDDEAE